MFKIFFSTVIIAFSLTAQSQDDEIRCFKDKIVGKWEGYVETPWTKPYKVTFEFRKDGTYSSKGGSNCMAPTIVQNEKCDDRVSPALYYGVDADDPAKKYKIENVINGVGEATIDIFFAPNTNEDEIKYMHLFAIDHETEACSQSGEAEFLEFKFYHHRTYGPLKYFLRRANSQ